MAIILFSPFTAVQADALSNAQKGLNDSANKAYGSTTIVPNDVPTLIGRIIGAVLSFIGLLFFLLVIYGGFLWMTARGNQQQVSQALDLLIAAVVGIVIVSAAYLITQYIGEAVFSGTASTRPSP